MDEEPGTGTAMAIAEGTTCTESAWPEDMRQMAACALAGRGLIDALERVLSTLLAESSEADRLEFLMLAHSASADIEQWWEKRT